VLGPTLFIACVNEVAKLKLSEGAEIVLFADDLVDVHPITSEKCKTDIPEDINKIQNCFNKLLLTLNASKCKAIMFSVAPKGPSIDISIHIGGETEAGN
jgi:hypothetical protein